MKSFFIPILFAILAEPQIREAHNLYLDVMKYFSEKKYNCLWSLKIFMFPNFIFFGSTFI